MKSAFFRFCLLVCIPFFGVACSNSEKLQDNEFLIEGKISGVEDGVVINLVRWDEYTGKTIASDTLKNGRFMFKGEAESNTDKLTVSPQGDGFPSTFLYVWITPGTKVKIKGKGKLHSLWEVKSSVPFQKEQNLYKEKSRDIIAKTARLSIERHDVFSKMMAASSRDEAIPYRKIVDSLDIIGDSLWLMGILADVNIMEKTNISPIWLENMVSVSYKSKPSNDGKEYYGDLRKRAEALYGRMSEDDKNTLYGARIAANLFPPAIVRVGDDMADTDFFDINGKTKRLSDYSGKYLLLDFWSSGCGPCIMAFPEMKEAAEAYSENLTIISISLDTDTRWKDALNTYDLSWINIRDPKSYGGLAASYGVNGIPHYVIISPEGKVIDKWGGYGEGLIKRKVSENVK